MAGLKAVPGVRQFLLRGLAAVRPSADSSKWKVESSKFAVNAIFFSL